MLEDTISISGLRIAAQIGVPDEERAGWQSLTAHLKLIPEVGFDEIADDITATVDYDAVAKHVRSLAASKPRKLIETLACELAGMLLDEFPLKKVEIELRKYILPDCDYVSVRIRRNR